LSDLLIERAPAAGAAPAAAPTPEPAVRKRETADATYEVYDLDLRAALVCRTIGEARRLLTGGFTDAQVLGGAPPAFAVGVGAFGDSFDDCRARFGELLSVAGATVYLPADGTNVPDYLVSRGDVASDVRLLYGLASTGGFARVVRFEARTQGTPLHLSSVLRTCLDIAGAPAIGVAIVAETVGLVGAALRRSPVDPPEGGDFFAHPGVRDRLAFTAEPAFPRGVALAAGVVAPADGAATGRESGTLRPLGPGCVGHLHAAAFPFRAIKKGRIDLADTVSALFEADQPLGVLHLLHDDRESAGAGESELVRGACWLAPLTGEW
jgi:hypothetical protein